MIVKSWQSFVCSSSSPHSGPGWAGVGLDEGDGGGDDDGEDGPGQISGHATCGHPGTLPATTLPLRPGQLFICVQFAHLQIYHLKPSTHCQCGGGAA